MDLRISGESAALAMLMLGRLDGRLASSPAADLWLARARLHGVVALAKLAGVPITLSELQDWICGRSAPPRHDEGLNDPISIASLFHVALVAGEQNIDGIGLATLRVVRTLLDDRAEAETWGASDLVHFGPEWRRITAQVARPYPDVSIAAVATRLLEIHHSSTTDTSPSPISTIDGRQLVLGSGSGHSPWLLAAHLPAAFHAAGITMRALPSFVLLPRHLPATVSALTAAIVAEVARHAARGLSELDRLEAAAGRLPQTLGVTKRSHAPLLARLMLAYPRPSVPAIARLLGISPQGAAKLAARLGTSLGTT